MNSKRRIFIFGACLALVIAGFLLWGKRLQSVWPITRSPKWLTTYERITDAYREDTRSPYTISTSTPYSLYPSETFIPEIPEKLLDTSDWNTYTSAVYGFSIKYPKDWRMREDEKNDENRGWIRFSAPNIYHDFNVALVIIHEDFIKRVRAEHGSDFIREERVVVNNLPMIKEVSQNPSLDSEHYSYLWSKNGWSYIYRGGDEPRYKHIQKTILFSMKFVP